MRAAENLLQAQEEIGPLLGRLSHSPTLCVMSLLLSELISHTGATNMTGPLAIGTALSAGFKPVPVAVDVALSAPLGFMLPVSTTPNAIVYASGYVPITKMIKSGVYIDFIGIAIAIVTIPVALYLVSMVVE